MVNTYNLTKQRKRRTRLKVSRAQGQRPRLSVFRSGRHIYAQVIDDSKGFTLAAASTLEKTHRESSSPASGVEAASSIGKLIAERAIASGIKAVVFDRGSFRYHGRVKALAEAARSAGLNF